MIATNLKIIPLDGVDFGTLYEAFSRAFADYAVAFGKEEVRAMLRRRGFSPRLSFAAIDPTGRIVAFTFNGLGLYDGKLTAYDTGTGTVGEYRGHGLAKKIFHHALPHLRQAGVEQYLLEVLQDNGKAIVVYRGIGFETTRKFICLRQKKEYVRIKEGGEAVISECQPAQIARLQDFCDFTPSWQNGIQRIFNAGSDLTCLCAEADGTTVGYCVFDSLTGDITQLAVSPVHRRRGIGSALLAKAVEAMETSAVKVLNIDAGCSTLPAFLRAANVKPAASQFEMTLKL